MHSNKHDPHLDYLLRVYILEQLVENLTSSNQGFTGAMVLYRVVFTRHAVERAMERGVGWREVVDVVHDPVQVYYDTWNDLYLYVGSSGCAVVAGYRGGYIEVVTVLSRREYEALISKYGSSRYKLIS